MDPRQGHGAVEGSTGHSTESITTNNQDQNTPPSERTNIDMQDMQVEQVEQVDQTAQDAPRVKQTQVVFSNKLVDVHMIQVPQDNTGLLDEPMLHDEEDFAKDNLVANKDSRMPKTGSPATGTPPMHTHQHTQELEETTTQSQDTTSPIGPLATAIASRHADLPTSACPMLCALRLLRFISWTLQDRSGAIDYQLLCAVAHGAIQRDPSLKKDILHLYTEMSEEVAAAILEGKPIPYLACVEIFHKLADRLPLQSYVNTAVEVTCSCANCGYKTVVQVNARELVPSCDPISLQEQLTRASDQGYVVIRRVCSTCKQDSCLDTHRISSFGDVLLCPAPSDFGDTKVDESLLLVELPPGARRTRGGAPSALLLRAVLYQGDEHFVVADLHHSAAPDVLVDHYDPLHGIVQGPPDLRYKPQFLVYSPVFGPVAKCDRTFKTTLPTLAQLKTTILTRQSRRPSAPGNKKVCKHTNKQSKSQTQQEPSASSNFVSKSRIAASLI